MSATEENPNHYVDRKEFYAALVEYRKLVDQAKANGEPNPPVSNYIGECILKISTGLGYRFNFTNYSYKDEMIMDGVEVCLRYAHNFNPEKSNHPFAYFNKICWQAFVHRIKKEKDQQRIKGQLIMHYSVESMFEDDSDIDSEINNSVIEYLKENSTFETEEPVRKKKVTPHVKSGIECFME